MTNEDGFRARKKRDCTIHAAKTNMLISCLVTAQPICAFDFANEKSRFFHAAAQMSLVLRKPVFGVFDQVRHKPGCIVIEDG